jgi:hypothetical protein
MMKQLTTECVEVRDMVNNPDIGESIFNPGRIFDLDAVYTMTQCGFFPAHLENNAEQLLFLEFNAFTHPLLPDNQPRLLSRDLDE